MVKHNLKFEFTKHQMEDFANWLDFYMNAYRSSPLFLNRLPLIQELSTLEPLYLKICNKVFNGVAKSKITLKINEQLAFRSMYQTYNTVAAMSLQPLFVAIDKKIIRA